MRWHEIFKETASGGATASGSVATNVGGMKDPTPGSLGVGFDASGDQGIYGASKKKPKAKKAPIIRR
jgi:hypothetical protein